MKLTIEAPGAARRTVPRARVGSAKGRLPVVPRGKRALDLALIALAAPGLVPLMLAIALLVKMLSRGPALFRQTRVGLGGQPFECFKFRTMHVNAPTRVHEQHVANLMKSDAPMTKLDAEDPRLFPLARMLRATGLDELPQVLNVLRGEMSLVGPRPSTLNEYANFNSAQRGRTNGLPGLTGLWQVSGKNRTTFNRMIELDLVYLQTQGVWLDLGILLRTPMVLVVEAAGCLRRPKAARRMARAAGPAPACGKCRRGVRPAAIAAAPKTIQLALGSRRPSPRPDNGSYCSLARKYCVWLVGPASKRSD